jgi:hypothetical protein
LGAAPQRPGHYACCLCNTLINRMEETAIHNRNDCHAVLQHVSTRCPRIHKVIQLNVIGQP